MKLRTILNKIYTYICSLKETFEVYRNHEEYSQIMQSTKDCRNGRIIPYLEI